MSRPRKTSVQTYRQIEAEGLLSKRRFEAYAWVFHKGPLTAGQLGKISGRPGLWKRLSELREVGVIVECGEVTCPVTGRQTILWDVTDKLPRDVVKDEKRKLLEEIMRTKARLVRLQRKLETIDGNAQVRLL